MVVLARYFYREWQFKNTWASCIRYKIFVLVGDPMSPAEYKFCPF